jgi:hypothetical protein
VVGSVPEQGVPGQADRFDLEYWPHLEKEVALTELLSRSGGLGIKLGCRQASSPGRRLALTAGAVLAVGSMVTVAVVFGRVVPLADQPEPAPSSPINAVRQPPHPGSLLRPSHQGDQLDSAAPGGPSEAGRAVRTEQIAPLAALSTPRKSTEALPVESNRRQIRQDDGRPGKDGRAQKDDRVWSRSQSKSRSIDPVLERAKKVATAPTSVLDENVPTVGSALPLTGLG